MIVKERDYTVKETVISILKEIGAKEEVNHADCFTMTAINKKSGKKYLVVLIYMNKERSLYIAAIRNIRDMTIDDNTIKELNDNSISGVYNKYGYAFIFRSHLFFDLEDQITKENIQNSVKFAVNEAEKGFKVAQKWH